MKEVNPKKVKSALKIGETIKGLRGSMFEGVQRKATKEEVIENLVRTNKINSEVESNLLDAEDSLEMIADHEQNLADIAERERKFAQRNQSAKVPVFVTRTFKFIDNVLKKPMDVLKKLLLGVLIGNIPRIVKEVNKFLFKANTLYKLLLSSFELVKNAIGNTLNVLNAILINNLSFDFLDRSKRLNTSIIELQRTFERDLDRISDLEKDWRLEGEALDRQLDEINGVLSSNNQNVQPQETVTGQPANGSAGATVRGTAEEYRIAAAVATEAGRGLSATDVLQVAANRVADPRYPNNFTDVFAAPGQFQGVFERGIGRYRDIKTAEDAAAFSGRSVSEINGYVGDLRNHELRANSANQIGGALEFRAAPQFYQDRPSERPSGTGSDGRIPGSSWRGGRGDNQILIDPSKDPMRAGGAAPITYNQGGSSTPERPQPPSGDAQGRALRSQVSYNDFSRSAAQGGTGAVGLTDGYLARGGRHMGVDIGTSGQKGWYVGLLLSGTVSFVGSLDGYGKTVIIECNGKDYLFAHLDKYAPGIRRGSKYNSGFPIGEIGNTGRSRGEHLHFEVRTPGGGSSATMDPTPYLNLLVFERNPNLSAGPTASKMSLDAISKGNKGGLTTSPLYYDHEAAEANNNIIVVNRPSVITKSTIVKQTEVKTQKVPVAINMGGSSSQAFNDLMMASR